MIQARQYCQLDLGEGKELNIGRDLAPQLEKEISELLLSAMMSSHGAFRFELTITMIYYWFVPKL